jgi:hypothetical protein
MVYVGRNHRDKQEDGVPDRLQVYDPYFELLRLTKQEKRNIRSFTYIEGTFFLNF